MRWFGLMSVILLVIVAVSVATAEQKNMGIRDTYKVTFVDPIRVGDTLLPAGDYVIRHTMSGSEHIMVFQAAKGKMPEVKVRCTLVPLAEKSLQTQTIYAVNAANERVLQELIFRGDTAKHVF